MPDITEMNDSANATADSLGRPLGGFVHAAQGFATQYAVSILVAAFVVMMCFPDSRFMPVPWQRDDFQNLTGHLKLSPEHPVQVLSPRPVSLNLVWYLGAAGNTLIYLVMFLLAALLPVLAVRLALRLFRCESGPWVALWLTAAVSFCCVLSEHSPWYYRYTGLMSNLTSVTTGMLAAYVFCRYLDGKRWAFAVGCLLLAATAFAKEDMILFVPLFVGADWCVQRLIDKNSASIRRLALVYGSVAVVGAVLYCWNKWIVYSLYTSSELEPYKQNWAIIYIIEQVWRYASVSRTPQVAFAAAAIAAGVGLLRRGHRVAAAACVLLPASMVLPYAILPRFFAYYSLNWLPVCFALSLVGIAVAWRPFAPGRLAFVPWMVPVTVIAAVVLSCGVTARKREELTRFINVQQENNRYLIQQVLHHQAEFAGSDTVALQGVDDIFTPWGSANGHYVNMKLGREVHWLLVARPETLVGRRVNGNMPEKGQVRVVSEQDLTAHPEITILRFDKDLNLTVHPGDKRRL